MPALDLFGNVVASCHGDLGVDRDVQVDPHHAAEAPGAHLMAFDDPRDAPGRRGDLLDIADRGVGEDARRVQCGVQPVGEHPEAPAESAARRRGSRRRLEVHRSLP